MKYQVLGVPPQEIANVEAALRILDHAAEITDQAPDLRFEVSISADFRVRIRILEQPGARLPEQPGSGVVWEFQDRDIEDPRYQRSDRIQRRKELVRLGVITLVGPWLERRPPWGILSGVRPTKIYHHLREYGFSAPEIREKLITIYGLAPLKARRLVEIGRRQEKYLFPPAMPRHSATLGHPAFPGPPVGLGPPAGLGQSAMPGNPSSLPDAPHMISVYTGIPFCPSRCNYCSFAAVSLETHRHLVKGFINSLMEEIRAIGDLCRELNLAVETIYVGGGTPTSLDDELFGRVLSQLSRTFRSEATVEFTVEAGRPETISPEKLQMMLENGVSRVSVNPQSMNQDTLERVGRGHTITEVYEAVDLVRQFPPLLLNMDLILGLPGENGALFSKSLEQVAQLGPENITIHTLAPKRAASWRKSFTTLELPEETELATTFERAVDRLSALNYDPYYLYRQRFILADQENIGFAKLGRECIYNIQMMEERQSILGLGGGAVTKWVVGSDFRIYRDQNPKCPATYSNLLLERTVKKVQQSRLLLG